MGSLKTRATLKASGKLGSYFSVSMAFTVWRETPSLSARSDWGIPQRVDRSPGRIGGRSRSVHSERSAVLHKFATAASVGHALFLRRVRAPTLNWMMRGLLGAVPRGEARQKVIDRVDRSSFVLVFEGIV